MRYKIPLTNNKYTIVDKEDYDKYSKYKWYANYWKTGWYATRRKGKNKVALHREILNAPKGFMVDHINGDGLDNRKCNLRICNNKENQANGKIPKNNTSGYKGVSWHKRNNKWIARIRVDSKLVHLGYFIELKDAAKAYNKAAKHYFGEFARLNEIPQ